VGAATIAIPSPSQTICRIGLHFEPTRVIDVVTVITAKGENVMTSSTEAIGTAPAPAAEAPKGARAGARRAHVAPAKGKAGKKASPAKKAPKGAKKAKVTAKTGGARDGSKAATILELLQRPGGATAQELQKANGWQPHSIRGFLSAVVGKKMGLTVVSTKGEDGERSYSVKS
jgi:hypothetical protein